jgi:hypothetical protein
VRLVPLTGCVCFLAITNRLSIGIFRCGFCYRITGEDANTSLPQAVNDKAPVAIQTSINWPKSHRDAGVLIVSDDEDDSDSEDDGMNQTRSGLLSL